MPPFPLGNTKLMACADRRDGSGTGERRFSSRFGGPDFRSATKVIRGGLARLKGGLFIGRAKFSLLRHLL
jgi:hypothetical protein